MDRPTAARLIDENRVEESLLSMVRCLYFADTFLSDGESCFLVVPVVFLSDCVIGPHCIVAPFWSGLCMLLRQREEQLLNEPFLLTNQISESS